MRTLLQFEQFAISQRLLVHPFDVDLFVGSGMQFHRGGMFAVAFVLPDLITIGHIFERLANERGVAQIGHGKVAKDLNEQLIGQLGKRR